MRTVQLAEVAAVLADPTRAAMCLALLDGRAWTVGELGRAVGVAPSSASEQVGRLAAAGFISTVHQGRHRYVRITDNRVAELVERLAEHAEHRPATGLRGTLSRNRLAFARTCYDHLAGRLGVAIRSRMLATGLIDTSDGLALTEAGRTALHELGVPMPSGARRPLLKECLDWTERREHLGGALPAALLAHAVDWHWLERGTDRSVRLLPEGHEPLAVLGVWSVDLGLEY
ncbi:metalloregulator ArsR/SmtB family transcription factor [Kutzneria viridogrisea]|uniref:DNA-binding transcriptional ArsR family regulator n=1 Tax=Kutzneria viridogrisea TaxID=47990 RepID=A0ABR6BD40_9PSEU|nr:DNA-binding transcriptional ArsR family regulator [Kutzneria viridogrisea]